MIRILFFLFICLQSLNATAIELNVFLLNDCKIASGLTVGADATNVQILGTNGQFSEISRPDIVALLIYNVVSKPVQTILFSKPLVEKLKEVSANSHANTKSLAWPIKVIEDTVVFYDVEGKVHVYQLGEIKKLRSATAAPKARNNIENSPVSLALDGAIFNCPNLNKAGDTRPSRIIRDPIQLQEYYEELVNGYEKIESFQERTFLYARPVLYKNENRLGFSFPKDNQEVADSFPIYFTWAGGEPYRFQSYNSFGGKTNEFTPNLEPVFSFRSEVKSHLFHALLIANINGISAGQSVLFKKIEYDDEALNKLGDLGVFPSFNYMGLIGTDYGTLSASVGYFFPTFLISTGNELREILATKVAYVARFMHTADHYRFRVIGSTNDFSRNAPTKDDIATGTKSGLDLNRPDNFKIKYVFVRTGIDYEWTDSLSTSIDHLFLNGKYSENSAGSANKLSFSRQAVSGLARLQFGDYTAISGRLNYYIFDEDFSFVASRGHKNSNETSFVGEFEFVF